MLSENHTVVQKFEHNITFKFNGIKKPVNSFITFFSVRCSCCFTINRTLSPRVPSPAKRRTNSGIVGSWCHWNHSQFLKITPHAE